MPVDGIVKFKIDWGSLLEFKRSLEFDSQFVEPYAAVCPRADRAPQTVSATTTAKNPILDFRLSKEETKT